MKKVIILLCIILAIIIIIVGLLYFKNNGLSFLNSNIENDVNIEENGDVENASDISMVIKDGTLTPSGATVVLTNLLFSSPSIVLVIFTLTIACIPRSWLKFAIIASSGDE